jgi:hypothetical protein
VPRAVALALGLVLWLRMGTALADDADHLLHRGVELRREGNDAEALAVFEDAYAKKPAARALAQIALAHQALGHWVLAEATLADAFADTTDPWVAENRAPLTEALARIRRHLGWLDVTTNVADASLSVDGATVGVLPQASPVRLVAGQVVVELRKPGYDSVRRAVEIPSDGRARETIPMTASLEAPTAGVTPSPVPGVTVSVRASHAEEPASARRTWGWVALATGSALLAGGVVASVVREYEAQAYNDDSRCFYGSESRDERCGGHRSAAEAATGLAIAGYASGAVAAGLGIFLLSSAPAGGQTAHLECHPSVLGASCTGAF